MEIQNTLELNSTEIKLILESLLFTSSVDVMGNFSSQKNTEFFNLATKIRSQYSNILTEDLEVLCPEKIPHEDKITSQILKFFPEIYVSDMSL